MLERMKCPYEVRILTINDIVCLSSMKKILGSNPRQVTYLTCWPNGK